MTEDELLAAHAHPTDDGRYWFTHPAGHHSRDAALEIIHACRLLGVQVTDVVTPNAWLTVVEVVTDLRRRVEALEAA